MHYIHPNRPESIVTWDWKEQPNWAKIEKALNQVMGFNLEPVIIEFETGDDEHAVMIAPEGFTEGIAKMQYDNRDVFFNS